MWSVDATRACGDDIVEISTIDASDHARWIQTAIKLILIAVWIQRAWSEASIVEISTMSSPHARVASTLHIRVQSRGTTCTSTRPTTLNGSETAPALATMASISTGSSLGGHEGAMYAAEVFDVTTMTPLSRFPSSAPFTSQVTLVSLGFVGRK